MNVAMIQLNVTFKAPHANEEALVQRIETAMQKRPDVDVLVFPELWNCGFVPTPIEDYADTNGEHVQQLLKTLAKKYHVNIIGGSTPVLTDGKIYNRSYVCNREGEIVAHYDKAHLFSLGGEDKIFTKGTELVTFALDNVTCGIAICYDLRFPEVFRQLALAGAKVIFLPAAWPLARLHHWLTLLPARAIENQVYIVACNAAGLLPNEAKLAGNSMIINPWGETVVDTNESESVLYGTLDKETLASVRDKMHVFADRRPELYSKPIHRY